MDILHDEAEVAQRLSVRSWNASMDSNVQASVQAKAKETACYLPGAHQVKQQSPHPTRWDVIIMPVDRRQAWHVRHTVAILFFFFSFWAFGPSFLEVDPTREVVDATRCCPPLVRRLPANLFRSHRNGHATAMRTHASRWVFRWSGGGTSS